MRSISNPLALRLSGDADDLSLNAVPEVLFNGGNSASKSALIGESVSVRFFSSSDDNRCSVSVFIGASGCGVAGSDSATVVAVALPVDEGGGEGGLVTAFEAIRYHEGGTK